MNQVFKRATVIWVALSCIALVILLRWPYVFRSADLDEGNYATIGMMLSRGAVLYRDIGDCKPPLIFYINALITQVFGSDLLILRSIFNFVTGLTSIAIFFTAKRLYGEKTAVIAALFFAVFSSLPIWGFFSPTNIYSSLTESIAIYFLIRALFTKVLEARYTFTAGIFMGISLLIRQTSILTLVAIVLWYLIRFSSVKPFEPFAMLKRVSKRFLWISLGLMIAFFLPVIYFVSMSAFNDMIFWVSSEPLVGLAAYTPWTIELKTQWALYVFLAILPLFPLAITALRKKQLWHKSQEELLLLIWFILPIMFFMLGPVPAYSHYYYQILPPLCVMAGHGSVLIYSTKLTGKQINLKKSFRKVVYISIIFTMISSLTVNVILAQQYTSLEDVRVATEVATFIKTHTAPNEKIFVFETQWPKIGPLIYYLSERLPPLPRPFFFTQIPGGITNSDVENVAKALADQDVKFVVVIGPIPPPDWYSTKILLQITSNYFPFRVITKNYLQHPWLPPSEVVIYKRMDLWGGGIVYDTIDNFERKNFIVNPSFDVDTSNWVSSSCMTLSRDTTISRSKPASGGVTGSSPHDIWNYVSYVPDLYLSSRSSYRMEVWIKVVNVSDVNNKLLAKIEQYDSSAEWLGNIDTNAYDYNRIGTWQRLEWSSLSQPLHPNVYRFTLRIGKSNPSINNVAFYFDDVAIIQEHWWSSSSSLNISIFKNEQSAERSVEGTSMQIAYDFNDVHEGWITIGRLFHQNLSLENMGLSLWVYGDASKNILNVDMVNTNGNFKRFRLLMNFEGWKHVVAPLSESFWQSVAGTHSDHVQRLHLTIEKTTSGASSGMLFIDEMQLLYAYK